MGSPGAKGSLLTLLPLCPGCSQACFSLFPSLPGRVLLFSKSISPRQHCLGCRAQPCPAACGWPGWAVSAGCGPSLARQGLPHTAGPWHPHPGHRCPLPALPVAPVSFPQLPLHYAEKAVEIRSVLLSRGHLEIKPSDLGFPGLTSFLPDRLRGPGCHGTLWLVMQRSLFSGRQLVFLQYFKANYPVSPLTFVLFCCVFWVFSGGDPAAREKKKAREQLLWVQTWWSPPKAIQSRGGSPLRDLSPMAPGHLEGSGVCGVSLCASVS